MQWARLGDYIEQCTETNESLLYGEDVAVGVNIDKELRETKANTEASALKQFFLLRPGCFAYNPRGSRKLGLGFNDTERTLITTYNFFVFKVKEDCLTKLLPEYLFMYLCRKEWDRHAEYLSWGSSTEYFKFETLMEVKLPLPSIDEQRTAVEAWRGLKNLKEQNEQLSGPLMDLCQSYLQELKHKYPLVEIGPYIEERKDKNSDLFFTEDDVMGVSNLKTIISTKAKIDKTNDLSKFTVIYPRDFVYNPRNGVAIALNDTEQKYIISWNNTAFYIKTEYENTLLPQFLHLWFTRSEFDRKVRFDSWGSSTEVYSFGALGRVTIPLPPIEIQRAIVEIYNCAKTSKDIAESAKQLVGGICPALMRQIIGDAQ